jgi:hypothetical protein
MQINAIRFGEQQAIAAVVEDLDQLGDAIQNMGLTPSLPVIVLIGGAGGVREEDWHPIRQAIDVIANVADRMGAAVVEGGTHSGIMSVVGKIRAERGYTFPLIGVAAEGTVTWPGREKGILEHIAQRDEPSPLDAQHTHFILVPGDNWGDESPWIAETATILAGEHPSVAILINGGMISRDMDVPNNLDAGRAVLVIEGTGRAADEFATHPPETDLMHFIHIKDLTRLENELNHQLRRTT